MINVLTVLVNIFVIALSLPVLGVPIYVYILLNLVVGGVIAVLRRGD